MPNYWHNGSANFFRDFFVHVLVLIFSYLDVLANTLDHRDGHAVGFLFIVVTAAAAFLREMLSLINVAANRPEEEEREPSNLAVFPACGVAYPDMSPIRFVQVQEIMQNITIGFILSSFGRNHPNGCGIEFPCVQCMRTSIDTNPTDNPQRLVRTTMMGQNYRGNLPSMIFRTQPLSRTEISNIDEVFISISTLVADIQVPDSPPPLIPVTPPLNFPNYPDTNHTIDEDLQVQNEVPLFEYQAPQGTHDLSAGGSADSIYAEVAQEDTHPHSPEPVHRGPFPPPYPSRRGGRQDRRPRNQTQCRQSWTCNFCGTNQHLHLMCPQQWSHLNFVLPG
ncbi:unnamed protein product [Orchesella dallaii]|uniref:Uncharacterized protein n=1 Tax=Orchesella dallaii TaxID=48710 RepID=A0ABP1QK16_9HEXA